MKKRRLNSRRTPPSKTKTLWLGLIVLVFAFLVYRGIKSLLPTDSGGGKKPVVTTTPPPPPSAGSTEVVETKPPPPEDWSFEKVKTMLPAEAFEDNFQPQVFSKEKALVAYAKKIPGKKPGPQGESNTEPGLIFLAWDGKAYQKQDLTMSDLEPAMGSLKISDLTGVPQIAPKPILDQNGKIYSVKIFLDDKNRYLEAFVLDDGQKVVWAPLHHASGKKIPAAFIQGTTRDTTQKTKLKKIDGKSYLIAEYGTLEDFKAYAGYDWNIQAYLWDGSTFVYDAEVSQKLTRQKELSPAE